MAYFNFLLANMTCDIDPWSDLDLETQTEWDQRLPRTRKCRCRAITWFYRTSRDMAYFHLLVADNDL